MNARAHVFELALEGREIEEVVGSLFNTLLLHRTLGKFQYQQEGSFSTGTVGLVDEDCDFIDFTHVRVASEELNVQVKREIGAFRDTLRNLLTPHSGQISLEFYERKRARWLFQAECIPWEVWTVKLDVITLSNEHDRQIYRDRLAEMLMEKVMHISDIMNRHEYVPKMPSQAELDLIFDTSFLDVQPYLFKISHQANGPSYSSVGTTMRKFIKDTLSL
ncbi:hypothetical protein ACJMK2_032751 [Sinanodonta woodiana]|uniref:Autophagy-related protein 101 n=1 Tax=Sinanodonta woodiana TaxID=1069815 RepID=A0ABD3X2P5_SINWO